MKCNLCNKNHEECICYEDFSYSEPENIKQIRMSVQEFWLSGKQEDEVIKKNKKLMHESKKEAHN